MDKSINEYLERYCSTYGLSKEVALSHALVREVINFYCLGGGKTIESEEVSPAGQ